MGSRALGVAAVVGAGLLVPSVGEVGELRAGAAAAVAVPAKATALRPPGGSQWSRYFPNVTLTTHHGKKVRFYDDLVRGKIVVINFMYCTCTGT